MSAPEMKEERYYPESHRLNFTMHLKLSKLETCFGLGVARLLMLVEETGSLNMASGKMHMAYSKANKIIKNAEKRLGFKLLMRRIGGVNGGGSELTPEGKQLMRCFMAFQAEANEMARGLFEKHFADFLKEPSDEQ